MRFLGTLVRALPLLLFACAHAPPGPARHGSRGADRPIPRLASVLDARSGEVLEGAALAARLVAARVVYVGERHPNPHDHAAQLALLEAAYAADPELGLGLEMLPHTLQPALDDYVAGRTDDATFLRAVDWGHTWGFPFGLYRPLLAFCRAHGLRAYALNAPRALTRRIAREGLDALDPDERRLVPALAPGPVEHRALVQEAFGTHDHGGRVDPATFERFYTAQLVWDETMAERVVAALAAPGAPRRLLVVAGAVHTRRFSVPARAERRGAIPSLLVLPVDEEDAAEARSEADVVWVFRR